THEPLDRIEQKRQGTILVNQFVDKRKDTEHIGNKRNMFGAVLGHVGTEEGVRLNILLTEHFAEALREAGYNAVILDAKTAAGTETIINDAVIDGEITEFWLDLYMAVWHKVEVKLTATDPSRKDVLWTKVVRGSQTNVLWLGISSEFEAAIRQALTKALNNAANDFASEEFFSSVSRTKKPLPEAGGVPR
ncbi:MAG: hypothetical protein Q8K68_05085, partial [Nitrospirota bacterium]|nr:hypothetical protein [Nitrospirota bacterium]